MVVKTVNITNLRNVLVQMPSFIVANWGVKERDRLEVHYNEATKEVTIKPSVR